MADYGIKISQPGFDVNTCEPERLAFSSRYKTLKVHAQGSGTVTHSSRTVTIAHNLGYVPVFLVHVKPQNTSGYFMTPYIQSGIFGTPDLWAYADSSNLYIKAHADYAIDRFYTDGNQYNYAFEYGGIYSTGANYTGNGTSGSLNGAFRFLSVSLGNSASYVYAQVKFYIDARTGTGDVLTRIRGINEDNTVAFNSGTAVFGRGRTTASYNATCGGSFTAGTTWTYNIENIITEIISRPGWASGNALALTFDNNSTVGNNDIRDQYTNTYSSYLEVLKDSDLADYKYTIFKNQLE